MTVKIKLNDNGSLKIEADSENEFVLVDGKGAEFGLAGRKVISICRCGNSTRQPFCDGSHKGCGFESCVTAVQMEPKG